MSNTIVIVTPSLVSRYLTLIEEGHGGKSVEPEVTDMCTRNSVPNFSIGTTRSTWFAGTAMTTWRRSSRFESRGRGKLLKDRRIVPELTETPGAGSAASYPLYGARPPKHAVQRHVPDPLARWRNRQDR